MVAAPDQGPRPGSRRFTRGFHAFFIVVSVAAGIMFVFKLFSFMMTIKREELAGFAFDPILVYAFVAAGFVFLLGWAYLTGQFRDIERPKYDMFERLEEQERQEAGLPPRRALPGTGAADPIDQPH